MSVELKHMDLDQLLSWVRMGNAVQATEAEKEIGARFKKVSDSRQGIFMQNVTQGVLLRDLQDFIDDLAYDASNSDDPDQWIDNWFKWQEEYKHYMFEKSQRERVVGTMVSSASCENSIHLAEGGDIVCPDCKQVV